MFNYWSVFFDIRVDRWDIRRGYALYKLFFQHWKKCQKKLIFFIFSVFLSFQILKKLIKYQNGRKEILWKKDRWGIKLISSRQDRLIYWWDWSQNLTLFLFLFFEIGKPNFCSKNWQKLKQFFGKFFAGLSLTESLLISIKCIPSRGTIISTLFGAVGRIILTVTHFSN